MEPFPQLHLPVQKAYATHSLYMVCFTNNIRGTSQKFLRLSHISHWPQNLTEVLCFFVSWEILQLAAGKNKFQNSRKALPSSSIQKLYWYKKKRKKKYSVLLSHKKVLSSISVRSLKEMGSQTYLRQLHSISVLRSPAGPSRHRFPISP